MKAGGSLNTRKKKGKRSFRFRYGPVELPATSNTWTKVELRLGKPAFRKARRAFRNGRSLYALIDISATDPSGNSRQMKLRMNIRRTKPYAG